MKVKILLFSFNDSFSFDSSCMFSTKGLVKSMKHFIRRVGWNVGGMSDGSLHRLNVSSNMFHPTCKFIHSFIRCLMKDGDGHEIHRFYIFPIFLVITIFLSFLNLSFPLFPFYTFFGLLAWPSLYSSPFCSCNLHSCSSYTTFLHAVWFFLFFAIFEFS